MIDRRKFACCFAAIAILAPRVVRAQSNRLPIIAFVGLSTAAADMSLLDALRRGLREAGLIDGQNIRIESRHADGDISRAGAMIAELTELKAAVFIAPGIAVAHILRRATTAPVVAVQLPPGQSVPGLYDSLARPGGNVTGFSSMGEALSEKRIELIKELIPGLSVLGILHNGTDPNVRDWGLLTEAGARAQGLLVSRQPLTSPSLTELARCMAAMRADRVGAVIVLRDFITNSIASDVARLAAEAKMAVVAEHRDFADAGALISYGPDLFDLFHRAGGYVAKILKGEKPAEMPIQLPTKFELVVNARTARLLGLTIPPAILIRADEVIE